MSRRSHDDATHASDVRVRLPMTDLGRGRDRGKRVGEFLCEQIGRCRTILTPPRVGPLNLRLGLWRDDDLARHRPRSFANTSDASRPWPA